MTNESENVKIRYEKRREFHEVDGYAKKVLGERNCYYKTLLGPIIEKNRDLRIIEIGAGEGANIQVLKEIGFLPNHIFANELIESRVINLRKTHPDITVLEGDALKIAELKFDVVFQSTVFTSILDLDFRKKLAQKMWDITNKDGFILWYDFMYNNPKNKDVRKVTPKEVKQLFPKAKIVFEKKITLAPPIGRRVSKFYNFFNFFPFLRTHYLVLLKKEE